MNKYILGFLCGLVGLPLVATHALAGSGLKKLPLEECRSLSQSEFKPTLSAEWHDYLAFTKVCPLRETRKASAGVFLVSVFIEEFYQSNPNEKEWKKFPLPLLISANDRCLAKLPEHFPFDQPVSLTLSFGKWQGNIPNEIAVFVSNPTVGGDYQLPKLFWDAKKQAFIARKNTDRHTIKEMECPI